jgi:hypothetical protein
MLSEIARGIFANISRICNTNCLLTDVAKNGRQRHRGILPLCANRFVQLVQFGGFAQMVIKFNLQSKVKFKRLL